MSTKDGGPAFPQGEKYSTTDLAGNRTDCSKAALHPGLSLRDYFAAAALPKVIAFDRNRGMIETPEESARIAYQYADAMLAVRSQS